MSSFEVRPGESVLHAVRRIGRHEIDDMLMHLRAGPRRHEAVHEARKSSKKLRALIRLVRDAIGEKRYRRENTTIRARRSCMTGASARRICAMSTNSSSRYGRR